MNQDGTPENPDGFQQQPPGQPGPPPGYEQPTTQPGYQQQGSYQQGYQQYVQPPQFPEESGAVMALVVSVIGIVACSGLLSPVGWYLGNKELAAIDEGRRDPSKRDLAKAGQIVGIIGSVLLLIGVLFVVAFFAIAIIGAAASG